ncbi:Uncharacterised protein [Bordetella ansorpii]|uniref:Phage protein n=1 Tax=Bordetella ansorpii TaxID=288768 RepID=A0A157RM98_9BORD|nr:hypothetical protein [Bordetella ansorpii]SAI59098.1 Uncharacterised protein [Bordetella ansorpii]
MSNYLIPHPPASIEQMQQAVIGWRTAAAHERFRIEHGLCCGSTTTASHNAALYEETANGIEREIQARIASEASPQRQLFDTPETSHA